MYKYAITRLLHSGSAPSGCFATYQDSLFKGVSFLKVYCMFSSLWFGCHPNIILRSTSALFSSFPQDLQAAFHLMLRCMSNHVHPITSYTTKGQNVHAHCFDRHLLSPMTYVRCTWGYAVVTLWLCCGYVVVMLWLRCGYVVAMLPDVHRHCDRRINAEYFNIWAMGWVWLGLVGLGLVRLG